MGDDFEVAAPDDYFQHFVLKPQSGELLEPQAGEIVPESQNTEELDAPQQAETTIIGLPPAEDPNLNKVFFGEAITTFRSMLKRYSLWNSIPKTDTVQMIVSGRFPSFPYLRGNVGGAVDTTAAAAPYNYVNTVLLHWVRNAFSGSRGSIRYKLVPRGHQHLADRIEVQRAPWLPSVPAYRFDAQSMNTYGSVKSARQDIMAGWEAATGNNVPEDEKPFPGTRGMALTTNQVNGALEFEMPYYNAYRFVPGKVQDYTSIQLFDAAWDYRIWYNGTGTGSSSSTYDVYVAAGEDFQTYFFTGLPRMYYEASPPA
jgi:hypothetical protein